MLPIEKIHCPIKVSNKILIYYIYFISKIYEKIFYTNYLVSLVL